MSTPQSILQVVTEASLEKTVEELLSLHGWLVYHTHDSRRSNPGFPDIVAVRGETVLFLELKTERGKLRKEQEAWGRALMVARDVRYMVVRPRDLEWLVEEVR